MAVEQVKLSSIERSDISGTSTLGIVGMIASPALLIEELLFNFLFKGENQNGRTIGLLGIIYIIGWACSLVGMRRLKVLGRNVLGHALFFIEMAGVSLAFIFSVMEIADPNPATESLLFQITDAAWPLSHLFMIVVGIYVLATGVWKGWRRATPLLCGLALPVFFALAALGARSIGGYAFGILTTTTFMLLGNAVRTGEPYTADNNASNNPRPRSSRKLRFISF